MAFTNIPANLQDMFYALTDRIAKLETGPNQAMYEAVTAYSVATDAQLQAINAEIAANNAASQATIAQAQATIASTQATAAQTSASGKNTNHYSTSAPGTTANSVGDLWFQYGNGTTTPSVPLAPAYANKVIAQFVGAGGTSWTAMPQSGLVVTNLDAGSITTGTLSAIQISAGSGSQAFNVSSAGALSATGAVISGNITASSGTFTGTVNAGSGYFGSATNGWSIGSTGLTGVGTATITGGAINGSTLSVDSGTIGGFNIGPTYLRNPSLNLTLNSNTGIVGVASLTSAGTITAGGGLALSAGGGALSMGANNINNAGTVGCGSVSATGAITAGTSISSTTSISSGTTMTANGELYAIFGGANTVTNAANTWMSTGGQIRRSTASSERYKTDIVNLTSINELDPKKLYDLPVRAFRYREGALGETDDRYEMLIPGFISEEVDAVYPIAADYENGPESWNDRILIPAILALIQEQNQRIKALEAS